MGTGPSARHRLWVCDVDTLQIARGRTTFAHPVQGVRSASSVDLRLMHSVAQIVIELGAWPVDGELPAIWAAQPGQLRVGVGSPSPAAIGHSSARSPARGGRGGRRPVRSRQSNSLDNASTTVAPRGPLGTVVTVEVSWGRAGQSPAKVCVPSSGTTSRRAPTGGNARRRWPRQGRNSGRPGRHRQRSRPPPTSWSAAPPPTSSGT